MRFFTSGISDKPTAALVAQATSHVLVDLVDLPNVTDQFVVTEIAIDSGAYRNFKAGIKEPSQPMIDAYIKATDVWWSQCAMRLALDVIGDPDLTMYLWQQEFYPCHRYTPVYQWGAPFGHLMVYLNTAPALHWPSSFGYANVVAIGGLAGLLRGGHREQNKAAKRRKDDLRKQTLDELEALCEKFPHSFHILGLNALEGIDRLRWLAASADSSKFHDGARYGYAIFTNTRTGKLAPAPAKSIPEYAGMTRKELLVMNARNITEYAHAKRGQEVSR